MKKLMMTLAAAMLLLPVSAKVKKQKETPVKPMKEFVDDLMARMTIEEKIGQLNLQVAGDITTGAAQDTEVAGLIGEGKMGGVFNLKGVDKIKALQKIAVEKSRLGIPLIVGMDVIHGYETIFPIPLALSCSWDLDAIERSARVAAREASADGINWFYSPMVDICIDARWGRVSEGNGEDPYLGSQIARAMVRGYQGSKALDGTAGNSNVMACLKHFALYGAVEAGRDYNTVDMSHLRMYNQYFPPYRAAVEESVGSVMSSFNLVDGEHATANRWLLNDVLRGQWGFDGFVVTDYASIAEMENHGFGNMKSNAIRSLKAGTDMDMCATAFLNTLQQSLNDGSITVELIDKACRRVLEAKYKLGLFHDPYKFLDPTRRAKDIFTQANRAEARKTAAETFVLLKNQAQTLPISGQKKIALVGPLTNDRANMAGTWCVAMVPEKYKTLKEAFEEKVGKDNLLYAQGSNICRDEAQQKAAEFGKNIARVDDAKAHAEAMEAARQADVIVCAMGECADYSGESSSRSDLTLPDVQMELLKDLCSLGKPVVLLNFSGRPTVLTWEEEHCAAIMNVWFGGSETADALCDVLFGSVSPSGKLTMTMPQSTGQVPIYYNHLNTGRPVAEGAKNYQKYASNYIDVRNDPLYPFGYGLSYTTFSYGKPSVESSAFNATSKITVTVDVTNTGSMDADEIVQLYIRDLACTISRPVKELKGFERISLKAGETKKVTMQVDRAALSYYNAQGELVFEPGEFDIMVGPDSRNVQTVKVKL